MAIKLEQCRIHPSSYSDHEFCTPLTHFDIPFLQSDPTQRLIFFDFPCQKLHFIENILPCLKNSLSLTLTHFLPLAGNVILPLNSGIAVIRHVSGDSVSLTIAQSDQDFNYLTGNHQRVADEFYVCVPELPPSRRFPDSVIFPVIALQITLFPGQGICIGITNHHAVSDGSSTINFVKSWACVNRFGGAFYQTDGKHFPVLDRNLVQDPGNLNSTAWEFIKKSRKFPFFELPPATFPINRVRSTFILTKIQVEKLKNYVSVNRRHDLRHISSFTVISAYVWICSVKAEAASAEETNDGGDDEEPVHFSFPADCRGRLNPPLPESYFGNCLVFVRVESKRGLLKKKDGFLIAVEIIAEEIRRIMYSDKGVLESADWPLDFGKPGRKCVVSVAGSPRFDVYEADFGWGKAKKQEFVHLDRERSISLCKSRDFEGGFEIGLSRKKAEMDVFEDVFYQGLLEIM
ncbi:hypothetical protein C2S52_012866 [Perilla frutescens var. hirtella]|nr:hypothetical protein C2S51_015230 [Perilla frutescens var. frutescens]KAH6775305.1 hypothetical protein C2S52_012866 [Perilla frutescens var. hirtella]